MPNKNVRPFAGRAHGLLEIKLTQLLAVAEIDEIVVSSNDAEVLDYANRLSSSRITTHARADSLSASTTSTDELVAHALSLIPDGLILWTHVTSPFFRAECYTACLHAYREGLEQGFDSLMTVREVRSFLWDSSGPMNYDKTVEKWPRTQTLEPVFEVNSAVFLHSAEGYSAVNDRIGRQPLLYPSNGFEGFDIDWPEDFELARVMLSCGIATC